MFSTLGPHFGYFSNGKERWIIAKPNKKDSVKEVFKETVINIRVKANTYSDTSGRDDKLTGVSGGLHQWEGVWLGERGSLIGKVRSEKRHSHAMLLSPSA